LFRTPAWREEISDLISRIGSDRPWADELDFGIEEWTLDGIRRVEVFGRARETNPMAGSFLGRSDGKQSLPREQAPVAIPDAKTAPLEWQGVEGPVGFGQEWGARFKAD
jgi:hypothetical protein